VFNADLALSVTMTAISTCLSVVLLPFNLLLYANLAYGDDLVDTIGWGSLAITLLLVIAAIGCGLYASAYKNSLEFHLRANRIGNFAGLILILVSAAISSSHKDTRLWDRDPSFYFGVGLPCFTGLLIANLVTILQDLPHSEIVTISVESCYQNLGVGLTIAMAMFDGEDLAKAVAVPFYYGLLQAFFTFLYCIAAWKLGWTKAPRNVGFWTMVTTTYEIVTIEHEGQAPHKEADGFFYVDHKDTPTEEDGTAAQPGDIA
jgi:predicted Na+-dependent transporter